MATKKVSKRAPKKKTDRPVVMIPTANLVPYARNARVHTEPQVAQVAGSIREFGWTNPVLVEPDLTIIAGHCRVLAAQRLEIEFVPCLMLEGLTPEQIKAYRIADNKLGLNSSWDDELLALELKELVDVDGALALTGFDDDELQKLLGGLPESANGQTFDEGAADDVKQVECPSCGHKFPI